ncbi:mobilisation protein (MobC) [Rhizobiales bacterium GAS113]|nr:mobilisation protein (MobC) [Rhizobiales bacterium GAS113]
MHSIRVAVSEEERRAVLALARDEDVTVSDYIRRLVRASVGLGPTLDGEDRALMIAVRGELRAIGVNLNQIARAMNTGLVPSNKHLAQRIGELDGGLLVLGDVLRSICVRAARPYREPREVLSDTDARQAGINDVVSPEGVEGG